MSDDSWITESVVQFTRSPLWRTPVDNFVDDNCWLFPKDSDMTVEQTEVHLAFRKLIDELLTSFVQDLGVSLESVLTAVHNSVEGTSVEKNSAQHFLNYIFYVDDFRSFHKMMVKQNIHLDILASRALKRKTKGEENGAVEGVADDEEAALKFAIDASLKDELQMREEMELEDIQIQEALALSIAAEEERIRRAGEVVHEEAEKAAAQVGAAVAEQSKIEKLDALSEEREQVIEQLETRALEVRRETLARHITATQVVPGVSPAVPPAVHKPPQILPTATATATPEEVPPASTAQKSAASVRPVAGKVFGFKPLPSIQPSFKELKTSVMKNIAPEKRESAEASTTSPPPTLEEMEARAQYMRDQREKILQLKKSSREKELEEYACNSGTGNTKTKPLPDDEKQMTIELTRRLREDIVREATR